MVSLFGRPGRTGIRPAIGVTARAKAAKPFTGLNTARGSSRDTGSRMDDNANGFAVEGA